VQEDDGRPGFAVAPDMQQFAVGGGESERVQGGALGRQGTSSAPMLGPTRRPPEMAILPPPGLLRRTSALRS
jgi:hypothetical protein